MTRSDAKLLEAASAGERSAIERLLTREASRIHRFALRMCGDPEDAKDVTQDTMLAAARGIRDFRGDASLPTWLYTIARSFCSKRRRRSVAIREGSPESEASPSIEALPDPGRGPDEVMEGKELGSALERAITALDPKYREVLVLRDIEGLTAAEVAGVMGIGADAVKSRLHRARVALRAAVVPQLGIPFAAEPSLPGCPDILTMLSRHLEGDLTKGVCAQMEAHLLACPQCRGRCDSLRRTLQLCRDAQQPEHLPPAVATAIRAALRGVLARP
jgi:RNA polymerase sigma-70 factor (ECF subfamily)